MLQYQNTKNQGFQIIEFIPPSMDIDVIFIPTMAFSVSVRFASCANDMDNLDKSKHERVNPSPLPATNQGTAMYHNIFLFFDCSASALSAVKSSSPAKRSSLRPTRAISSRANWRNDLDSSIAFAEFNAQRKAAQAEVERDPNV